MNEDPIRCLVSAGPTREFFDPVRFISNPSSGKMGFAMAEAALSMGWQVDLVSGPVSLPHLNGASITNVVTGAEMLKALDARFDACHVLIMAAAVMDYRPVHYSPSKAKKTGRTTTAELEPVPDILMALTSRKQHQFVIGFAAETENLEAFGRQKLLRKCCDLMLVNRVGVTGSGFQSDTNELLCLHADGGRRMFGPGPKGKVALEILRYLAPHLKQFRPDSHLP